MIKDATVPPGGTEEQEGRGGRWTITVSDMCPKNFTEGAHVPLNTLITILILPVAEGLGKFEIASTYYEQANNWKNLWREISNNGSTGFIMPRNADGSWADTINCDLNDAPQESINYHPLARIGPLRLLVVYFLRS